MDREPVRGPWTTDAGPTSVRGDVGPAARTPRERRTEPFRGCQWGVTGPHCHEPVRCVGPSTCPMLFVEIDALMDGAACAGVVITPMDTTTPTMMAMIRFITHSPQSLGPPPQRA